MKKPMVDLLLQYYFVQSIWERILQEIFQKEIEKELLLVH